MSHCPAAMTQQMESPLVQVGRGERRQKRAGSGYETGSVFNDNTSFVNGTERGEGKSQN